MIKISIFFLLAGVSVNALAAPDPVKEYAGPVQRESAFMQVCGETHGEPYSRIPAILDEKYRRLVKISGKKISLSSHLEKIKTHTDQERKSPKSLSECKTKLVTMKGFVSKMDADIQEKEKAAPGKS